MYQEQACENLPVIRSGRSSTSPFSLYLTTLPLEKWPPVTTTESPSGMEQDNLKRENVKSFLFVYKIYIKPYGISKRKSLSDSSIISCKFWSLIAPFSPHEIDAILSFPACVETAPVLKSRICPIPDSQIKSNTLCLVSVIASIRSAIFHAIKSAMIWPSRQRRNPTDCIVIRNPYLLLGRNPTSNKDGWFSSSSSDSCSSCSSGCSLCFIKAWDEAFSPTGCSLLIRYKPKTLMHWIKYQEGQHKAFYLNFSFFSAVTLGPFLWQNLDEETHNDDNDVLQFY